MSYFKTCLCLTWSGNPGTPRTGFLSAATLVKFRWIKSIILDRKLYVTDVDLKESKTVFHLRFDAQHLSHTIRSGINVQ